MGSQEFPSPYGVSFILIGYDWEVIELEDENRFPSPYGVSFILIGYVIFGLYDSPTMFPSPYGVSFILIVVDYAIDNKNSSFRLLTEYHSFL